MSTRQFEDSDVWKRTARLIADIYKELSHINVAPEIFGYSAS